jgi:hypothetical protein
MSTQFQDSIAAWQHSNSISITEYSLHVVFLVQMPRFRFFVWYDGSGGRCAVWQPLLAAVVARRL